MERSWLVLELRRWDATQESSGAVGELDAATVLALADDARASRLTGIAFLGDVRAIPMKLLARTRSAGLQTLALAGSRRQIDASEWTALREAGLQGAAVELLAGAARSHDALADEVGSFRRALSSLEAARDSGLHTEVHTFLTVSGASSLERLAVEISPLGIARWWVCGAVPPDLGRAGAALDSEEFEHVSARVESLRRVVPYAVSISRAAPRVVLVQSSGDVSLALFGGSAIANLRSHLLRDVLSRMQTASSSRSGRKAR